MKSQHLERGSAVPGIPRLKVFILYEDRDIGMRAKGCLDQFFAREDLELEYHLDVCRFDVLEVEEVRLSMLQQAGAADVVAVAMHGQDHFPGGARLWLQSWIELKGSYPCALLVLVCEEGGSKSMPSSFELVEIPPHANVQVLECVRSEERTSFDLVLNQLGRRSATSGVLRDILQQREPFSHWGIND
jgi:hypothetical protein